LLRRLTISSSSPNNSLDFSSAFFLYLQGQELQMLRGEKIESKGSIRV
jgi:hypothetical protein